MLGSSRLVIAAAAAVLAVTALTACTGGGGPAASSASQEGTDVDLQSVYSAISAADPGWRTRWGP
jgi:ABC-type glycerol-3-phosphate transport system substrate-binding protein